MAFDQLSLGKERQPLDPATLIDAFAPQAPWQARATTTVRLARHAKQAAQAVDDDAFSAAMYASLLQALQENDTARQFAAIRLVSAMYTFAPQQAHRFVFDRGLLQAILARATTDTQAGLLTPFVTAELLCLASSYTESRKALAKTSNDKDSGKEAKIVEVEGDGMGQFTAVEWLAAYVERTELENPAATTMLSKVALLASLTLHKLTRAVATGDLRQGEPSGPEGLPKDKNVEEAESKQRREEDEFLFQMCNRHVLLNREEEVISFANIESPSLAATTAEELGRTCQVSAIEGLSYLSLQPAYRNAMAQDKELLIAICSLGKTASQSSNVKARSLFPVRGTTEVQGNSMYEIDKTLASRSELQAPDTALQFGVVSILANFMAYPAAKSKEQQQMDKLRRMANARPEEGAEEAEPLMGKSAVEERIACVLNARGVETLAAVALAGTDSPMSSSLTKINSSDGVRQTVSLALMSATTRQDKRQRGQIVQQGGARALVAIANYTLAQLLDSNGKSNILAGAAPFSAMQSLSHLLITENPSIVLSDPLEAVPALAFLYLHANTTRLQRFEACLALTNVASLSLELAERIARAGFAQQLLASTAADEFVGQGRSRGDGDKVDVAHVLRERIFMEDNELSRRASLELLCNLLAVDDVFQQWSGETEDEQKSKKHNEADQDRLVDGRAARDLTYLIALCAPAGLNAQTNESGLKLRLAASGAVATLSSSASTCARLLAFEPRLLNKLCRLVEPTTTVQESNRIVEIDEDQKETAEMGLDEDEEARLQSEDVQSDALGPEHGEWQLALRGLTCIECLVHYLDWLRGQGMSDVTSAKRTLVAAGAVEAVKGIARRGAHLLKHQQSTDKTAREANQAVEALQTQVTKQALSVLTTMQMLGTLSQQD